MISSPSNFTRFFLRKTRINFPPPPKKEYRVVDFGPESSRQTLETNI